MSFLLCTIVFGTAEWKGVVTFAFVFLYWFTLVDPLVLMSHIQKFSIRMIWCKSFCTSNTSEKLFRYSHSPPLLMISWHLIELTGGGCTCNCCNCRCVNKVTLIEHKRQGHSWIRRRPLYFSMSLFWVDSIREGNKVPSQGCGGRFLKVVFHFRGVF